jgi:hypothetical protein
MMPDPITDEALHDRFHYHPPSRNGIERHAALSDMFTAIATLVRDTVPYGREQSLAMTKLEEAKFWASAGVARNPTTR